jgi:hypothetical protein
MMVTPPKRTPSAIQWFLAISMVSLVAVVIVAGIVAKELNFSATVALLMVPVGAIVAAFVSGIGGGGGDE